MPLFVAPEPQPQRGAAGDGRHSVETLVRRGATSCARLGVGAVLLFGIPEEKDDEGSGAWDDDGIVQRPCARSGRASRSSCCSTDVCLCEYTSHGHCGVLDGGRRS